MTSAARASARAAEVVPVALPTVVMLHRDPPDRVSPATSTNIRAARGVVAQVLAQSSAPVAQGIEHRSPKAGVGSSNLPRRTVCWCRSGDWWPPPVSPLRGLHGPRGQQHGPRPPRTPVDSRDCSAPLAFGHARTRERALRGVLVTLEWPDRREDVLAGLECLAAEPPRLSGSDADPRWPDVTNAIHWLVDDTWWDTTDPSESIGLSTTAES